MPEIPFPWKRTCGCHESEDSARIRVKAWCQILGYHQSLEWANALACES